MVLLSPFNVSDMEFLHFSVNLICFHGRSPFIYESCYSLNVCQLGRFPCWGDDSVTRTTRAPVPEETGGGHGELKKASVGESDDVTIGAAGQKVSSGAAASGMVRGRAVFAAGGADGAEAGAFTAGGDTIVAASFPFTSTGAFSKREPTLCESHPCSGA